MSIHLDRARLLLQQSRPADAEREAGLAVAQAPDRPEAHALLALSRLEQKKHALALVAARTALGLAPDGARYHYIHALALHGFDKNKEAVAAVEEAIRLAPGDADNFSLLAAIQLNLGNREAALAAAEQALALDPESTEATNFRSMALMRLGRKEEAATTVGYALERDPESPLSHATQGWNCLHRNDPRQAREHFREALRLDPNLEFAREGMMEALKARNWLYRGLLAYFLWMTRLAPGSQWGLIIGCYFASRFVSNLASAQPDRRVLWWAILLPLYGFIYLTWTARPLFDLFLRLDRFGCHLLSREQRIASNWFAPFFFSALGALVWTAIAGTDAAFFSMFILAALSVCVSAAFTLRGRNRLILAAAASCLAGLAILAMMPVMLGTGSGPNRLVLYFIYGFLGFQLLSNVLATRRE